MTESRKITRAAMATAIAIACGTMFVAAPGVVRAQQAASVALRDTFPIGSNGLCEAQIVPPEPGAGLFDRRYSVICRDAAAPVGSLWVVKESAAAGPAAARFVGESAACSEDTAVQSVAVPGLASVARLACKGEGSVLSTDVLIGNRSGRTYAAAGLPAYSKALELGLASLATDAVVSGAVDIPLTSATDELAFARQQAESIAADQAMSEAYRRSNAGNFAEAAEFFAVSAAALVGADGAEAQFNTALQQSNLGNFADARRRFNVARSVAEANPVLARILRNYEAMDALNQRKPEAALAILGRPMIANFNDADDLRQFRLNGALASQLASENERITSSYTTTLTPIERATLLDGQNAYLKATAVRLVGRPNEATALLAEAEATLGSVRGGRVVSIAWLRAQVLAELAETAERSGQAADAERFHKSAISLIEIVYPGSPALGSARAQLAGLYSRTGRRDEALAIYRAVVADSQGRPLPSLRAVMRPFFSLLTDDGQKDSAAAADLFAASQLLQRPGLAQTQAALARELSEGSDEAAQLFRSATNLGRAIEQVRLSVIDLESAASEDPRIAAQIADRRAQLTQLQEQQAEVLGRLAAYPRYRAVSESAITLVDLQAILNPDEAYVKLVTLDTDAYVIYATRDTALAWRADATPKQLDTLVSKIRDSIAVIEDGQVLTYPFDIVRSRELYVRLFGPVADALPKVRHLIFEPDGALLKLPINLLVTDDASVAAYQERMKQKDPDEYDFRGTAWLGRTAKISTSVAASAFREVRRARPSEAKRAYLGLGENTPIGVASPGAARTRAALEAGDKCQWSPNIWANPIKGDELREAAGRLGGASRVLTRNEFTDTAILGLTDLTEYRILHFATHGLVTAPQPGCPPRPALLTSFDTTADSDGLLTFGDIFSLRIDADLVILSACDTAGGATVGATREAGVTSGGDFALDGLVRAFVGAGGRTVLASHWPVPDDFGATGKLISGLFAETGQETAGALNVAQIGLMNQLETSHPFYWSAFAVVGDGTVPVIQ